MVQHIRTSQFITIYGPGAIVESRDGPRVVLRPDLGLFTQNSNLRPEDFVISDQRMEEGLLGGTARIFRLPSNARLRTTQDVAIYRTRPFPDWRLCTNAHGQQQGQTQTGNPSIIYLGRNCPVCHDTARETQEPIRFIVACPLGHMDDIDWNHLVHFGRQGCRHANWFMWLGGGGALNDVEVECPDCHYHNNMGWAYGRAWHCSARRPEDDPPNASITRPRSCQEDAWIIQRQASNLHIPELRMLLSIPRRHTALHNMLGLPPIRDNLYGAVPGSLDDLRRVLQNLVARKRIRPTTVNQILAHPWTEIRQSIDDVLTPIATTYHELILEEFIACIDGSLNGVPAISAPPPTSTVIFEMDPNLRQIFRGPNNQGTFRIAPITNMRTVTVQTGYRREVNSDKPAMDVDVGFGDRLNANEKWYPGVDFLGEGLFITLHDNGSWHFPITGASTNRWNQGYQDRANYPEYVFRGPGRDELTPLFVWWHTLSHLLMRSVSIEAGYSAASIRERVYVQTDGNHSRGGIVLYATKPGSEGSLGGLMALAPYFDDILHIAFDMLATCSGDPLCIENEYTDRNYNGAACYGCLLASETSCEHRNMWLDRAVVLENMP